MNDKNEKKQSKKAEDKQPEAKKPETQAIMKQPTEAESEFALVQRRARAYANSSMVPDSYRNENGIPNCIIAMDISKRIGSPVLMVMQNLDIIYGRPSWRATFLIATVNACKRFSPIRYKMEGKPGTDEYGCRAYAKDLADNEILEGPLVNIQMAKDEGWYDKKGSKWKTMPELMLRYRSASYWAKTYAPEISMGLSTTDEMEDMHVGPAQIISTSDAKSVEAEILGKEPVHTEATAKTQQTSSESLWSEVNATAQELYGDNAKAELSALCKTSGMNEMNLSDTDLQTLLDMLIEKLSMKESK